jgi:hypothetical protein
LLVLARLLEWASLDSSVICVGIGLEFDCDILFCGGRYDDMVLEAVLGLNEPDGSSSAAIANYIEERYPVPSNFRRLLTTKLKSLALSGKLMKVRFF